ncbi:MAG TPA: beta-ketoacyl synthase N-terminal-like domain-containing protein, partial [Thermomicrobiaceae bacterium]|nr:beta-ketoacyl synthase N-terminal-like domain-containing protein [Thermomicrobiaceae bacterium]
VGILGFVPPELRAEQLAVLRTYHPPFVLIAGGRPDQAKDLEADGITTYLHVPSPTLLRMYMRDGARRFVFEGRECGGHVGPRTSFVLWDSMVEELLESLPPRDDPGEYHVLFAGGIHDDLSGAMVAAIAAPLVERGVRVGALMGTAYLFTEEVVRSGAITPGFQQAALDCDETVLLVSGPGQATRCLPSPFVDAFESEKRRLLASGLSAEALKNELEVLNIGRLRIASKGLDRHPDYGRDPSAPRLTSLSDDAQWQRGMYMIGQVAGLHHEVRTIRELHQTVSEGSTERLAQLELRGQSDEAEPLAPADVAIVGIGCILPGAPDLATFWSNILNKVDSVTEVPESRWDWRNYYDADRSARDKIYSRWGGFIDDVPFDPVAFGMPPASLASIEPFQLLGLLVVQAALKDAGLLDRPFPRERTSVILGAGGGGADLSGNYVVRSSLPELLGEQQAEPLVEQLGPALPEWTEDSFPGILMNVAAGRIANRFDFGGTNFTVDAACASSLAAIYLAARDLQSGNSDVAVAGGVDAIQNPFAFLCFSKTQALSPSGRCRPFDAQADGIAISEGYAAVILKRLADAERDGDRIYAVIRGVGSSSDGRDRSMTAPRPEGQIRAMRRAYRQAGFSPATVGLIEAHGTGTVAGDQAEIESLTRFFNESAAGRQQCAVGSVKSMIGHTKAAAGVAGLIKAALALHTRILPPTLGVSEPNPKANFSDSPFYVNTETSPWVAGIDGNPRRAGVSAFGFGGTNFHIVLEEYTGNYLPLQRLEPERWPAEVLVWRGESRQAILDQVTTLSESLASGAQPNLADLSYTLAAGPAVNSGEMALAIVAESVDDLRQQLEAASSMLAGSTEREHSPAGIHFAERPMAPAGKVAFLFPGQGSQTVNMGRDIAIAFPEAFSAFELADRVLAVAFERPLSRYIFPPPVFSPDEAKQLRAELTETNIAQPALGVTELAYLKVLQALGVQPEMTAGHSYGEFVALRAAGCFDDDTLLRLSEARGRFMREGAGDESGTMAAIMAGPDALRPLLEDPGLTLANLNAPQQTVVSGSREGIERAIGWAREHGLRAQRLPVACAFHSPFVAPAQQRLVALLGETPFSAPRIPVYSNTIARPYPADPDAMVDLLGDHLVRPVDWTSQVKAMYEDGARIFVEAGPRSVLSNLVDQILPDSPHLCLPVEQSGKSGLVSLLNTLAALAVEGVPVRLDRLFAGRSSRRLDLNDLAANSKPSYSPTTWFVNGGRARPAAVAATPASARSKVHLASVTGRSEPVLTRSNGAEPAAPVDASKSGKHIAEGRQYVDTMQTGNGVKPMVSTAPRPVSADGGGEWESRETAAPAGHSEYGYNGAIHSRHTASTQSWTGNAQGDTAIDRFQDVMRHFLDVQRDVMLSYLQGGQGARGASGYRAAASPRRLAAGSAAPVAAPRPIRTLPAELAAAPEVVSQAAMLAPAPAPAPQHDTGHRPVDGRVVQPGNGHENGHVMAETKLVPAAPSVPSADAPPDRETITSRLLAIVSERTGYPTEML